MHEKIAYHVIQRYKDRGLKHIMKHDLSMKNVKTMITTPEGIKIVYTKNNLRYIIKNKTVVTIMKIRPKEIRRELIKYGYMEA